MCYVLLLYPSNIGVFSLKDKKSKTSNETIVVTFNRTEPTVLHLAHKRNTASGSGSVVPSYSHNNRRDSSHRHGRRRVSDPIVFQTIPWFEFQNYYPII